MLPLAQARHIALLLPKGHFFARIFGVFAIFATFCGLASAGRDVRVGIYNYSPLVFLDSRGAPSGLFIDVVDRVAAKKRWKVKYVSGTWQQNLDWLNDGKIDLALSLTQSSERKEHYSLNKEAVVSTWAEIYSRPNQTIKTIRDLDGKSIAALRGDINLSALEDLARAFNVQPKYVEEETVEQAFELASSGQVDACMSERIAGRPLQLKDGVVPSPVMFYPQSMGFGTALGKNRDLLDAFDEEIRAERGDPNSVYERSISKWLGEPKPLVIPKYLIWSLSGAAALSVLFAGMSLWLRRQVALKTLSLSLQNESLQREIAERERAEQALRVSEARFKSISESAWTGIQISCEGVIKYANPASARILGYSRNELVGMELMSLIHPSDRQRVSASIAKRLIGEGNQTPYEIRMVSKDGAIRNIEVIGSLVEHDGHPAILGNLLDITDRKRDEETIREQTRLRAVDLEQRVAVRTAELESANRELETFSYSVSHDLRAPLRAIRGFSQILLEDCAQTLDDESKANLSRIVEGAERMGAIIDDLLRLAKVTRVEMRISSVDLSAIVRETASRLHDSAPERDVTFNIADGIVANGDESLLKSLIHNLLENSWKYTSKHDAATIEFGVEIASGHHEYFVKDDGAGFEPKYAKKLFDPFQRLHSARDFPGTGVGLATVQRIVRRHGGEIWAEGAVEHGAAFYFTLNV